MKDRKTGAEVQWDYQIGTFTGALGNARVGLSSGEIVTVPALETALGVTLSASVSAALQEQMEAAPYMDNKRFVSKLQFMDLFRPADLVKIYDAAKTSSAMKIALDRVDRAPNDQVELTDQRTITQLNELEAGGFIQSGDADRISKGISWQ
jgi:hypothetical protein